MTACLPRCWRCPVWLRAAPLVKGQVMITAGPATSAAEVFGLTMADLKTIPRVGLGAQAIGDIERFNDGIAIGSGIARELNLGLGDRMRLIAPNGVKTAFGTSPRVNAYEVVYIFTAGRFDIDRTRVYMPLAEAQSYFNREGMADEFEVMVADPEAVEALADPLLDAAGPNAAAVDMARFARVVPARAGDRGQRDVRDPVDPGADRGDEHRVGPDHAGQEQGARHRHPAHHGSDRRVGPAGVLPVRGVYRDCWHHPGRGRLAACLRSISTRSWASSTRSTAAVSGIPRSGASTPCPPNCCRAMWRSAVALSLGLSFVVTIFPARRAARMNPVEALRYE